MTTQTQRPATLDSGARALVTACAWLRDGQEPPPGDVARVTDEWRPIYDALSHGAAVGRFGAVLKAYDIGDTAALVKAIERAPKPRQTHFTTAELLALEIDPPRCIVHGLVYEGLNLLGGRPKVGKSWLAQQVARAKRSGGVFLGQPVDPGDVLYIALEDNEKRLKKRMKIQGWQPTEIVDWHTSWSLANDGGIDDLKRALDGHRYDLVVIDTASRFFGRDLDQMDPGDTNATFGELQRIGLDYATGIWLIDHHRKPNLFNPHPVDDLLGSTGKAAPADLIAGLYSQQGKRGKRLMVVGRDLDDDIDLTLEVDRSIGSYLLVGKTDDVRRDTFRAEVLEALAQMEQATTTELARWLSQTGQQRAPSNVSRELTALMDLGYVTAGEKQGKERPYLVSITGRKYLESLSSVEG